MGRELVTAERELRRILGRAPFSAAVLCDGEVRLHCHTPPEPLLPVYSLTKTYIAVLALLTVRCGRLRLDAPLADYYPDVPGAAQISLAHLLSHTAGLPDYGSLEAYRNAVAGGEKPWSFQQFAERTWQRGLAFAPGSAWRYSNPGYALVVGMLMGEPGGMHGPVLGHGGGGPGYTTAAYYFPRSRRSVAVIAATEDEHAVLTAALQLEAARL